MVYLVSVTWSGDLEYYLSFSFSCGGPQFSEFKHWTQEESFGSQQRLQRATEKFSTPDQLNWQDITVVILDLSFSLSTTAELTVGLDGQQIEKARDWEWI